MFVMPLYYVVFRVIVQDLYTLAKRHTEREPKSGAGLDGLVGEGADGPSPSELKNIKQEQEAFEELEPIFDDISALWGEGTATGVHAKDAADLMDVYETKHNEEEHENEVDRSERPVQPLNVTDNSPEGVVKRPSSRNDVQQSRSHKKARKVDSQLVESGMAIATSMNCMY